VAAHPARELLIVDDLPAIMLGALEIERAPRDENSVPREIDQMEERLTVDLRGAHRPSMPFRRLEGA
jgi:hypothetical protein